MVSNERLSIIDLIMISLGCAFYGLGLVSVNIANHLAEGGVTGITLIIRYWLHIDPALSTILINIPLIIIGYRYLGKKALVYTVYGTLALSFWIWFWQRFYIPINIHNDLFIAGILAGILLVASSIASSGISRPSMRAASWAEAGYEKMTGAVVWSISTSISSRPMRRR